MDLLSQNHLEPEFDFQDGFPKGVFQDLHQLEDFSLHPEYANHVAGYDPFGPLPYGFGSNDLDSYEYKPLEHVNNDGGMVVNLNNHDKSFMGWHEQVFSTRLGLMECPIQDPKPIRFFVPDEGSCVTADNVLINKGNRKSYKGQMKSNSSKGQWTKEEDRILREMVEKYGMRKWSYIAQMLKGRIGKQCRERWHNHLRPDIKKDFWTEEEDRILIAAHAEVGNKWSEIAKKLPGRTENSTKNHWNATKRRQYTKRKCRSKWPRPSPILQNYIKSLNLPRGRIMINSNSTSNNVDQTSSMVDFDFKVPELAMDENLLEWDDGMLDDHGGGEEVDSYFMASGSSASGLGEVKKEMDLMEMISQVNL